jgi:Protein of unknown function (DUF4256)
MKNCAHFMKWRERHRSVCYDGEALESRKEHKPEDNAIDVAAAMGIELLTEEQYRELQTLGNFDTKTSSWRVRRSESPCYPSALLSNHERVPVAEFPSYAERRN